MFDFLFGVVSGLLAFWCLFFLKYLHVSGADKRNHAHELGNSYEKAKAKAENDDDDAVLIIELPARQKQNYKDLN